MDQGEFNAVVLRMLDEYRHARIQTNSPTDHLWAIHEHLDALLAQYDELHAVVYPDPVEPGGRYHRSGPPTPKDD